MRLRSSALTFAALLVGCSSPPSTDTRRASAITPLSAETIQVGPIGAQSSLTVCTAPACLASAVVTNITVPANMLGVDAIDVDADTSQSNDPPPGCIFTPLLQDGTGTDLVTLTANHYIAGLCPLYIPSTVALSSTPTIRFGLSADTSMVCNLPYFTGQAGYSVLELPSNTIMANTSLGFSITFTDTLTALTVGPSSLVAGGPLTATATVTGYDATTTPTGSITFMLNNDYPGTSVALVNGTATLNATAASGTDTISATYVPSDSYGPSHAVASANAATPTATTTTLGVSPSSPNPSSTTMLTATVSTNNGGTVTFYDGSTAIPACSGLSLTSNVATCSLTFARGTHSVTATFTSSDASYTNSTSTPAAKFDVEPGTTGISVATTDTGTVYYGSAPPTLTATLTSGNGTTPTMTVTFSSSIDGTLCAGNVTTASGVTTASCTPSKILSAGTHTITGSYSGDTNNAANSSTVSDTITKAVAMGTFTTGGTANVGDKVTFTASYTGVSAMGAAAPAGSVTFQYKGPGDTAFTTLGSAVAVSGGSASKDITFDFAEGAGSYTIQAIYSNDTDYTAATLMATETVNALALTDTLTASPSAAVPGANVTLTATFTGALSDPAPAGLVSFYDGTSTTALGTGTITNGAATFSTTTLSLGTHNLRAVYAGDKSYAAPADGTVTVNISTTSTQIAVTSDAGTTPHVGDTIHVTATLTGSGSTMPGGTVKFTSSLAADASVLAACNAVAVDTSSETAKCTLTGLAYGSRTITATYSGDMTNGSVSGSLASPLVINRYGSTTTIAATPTSSSYGQSVTFTSTTTHATYTAGLAGSVVFSYGSKTSPAITPDTSGKATFTVSTLDIGNTTVTVGYSSDPSYGDSTAQTSELVTAAVTTTALTSSSNPSDVFTAVSFTAVVTPAVGSAVPDGMVSFFDGETSLGSATLTNGTASITTSALIDGPHAISAAYVGNTHFVASTSTTITQNVSASAATLTVSASPSPASFGQAVMFSGAVTGSLGTATGSITVSQGSTTLGTITLASGLGTVTTSALSVGTHTIGVAYSGDGTYGTSTGSVVLVVNAASTSTMLVSSANPSTVGEDVTFTVTVTSSATGVAGNVELFDGQASLGSVSLTNGTASFAVKSLKAGSHTIQAQFTGTASFAGSASMAIIEVVNGATSTMDGGTVVTPDGSVGNDNDASTTPKPKAGGGCDVANGSASGALVSLLLLAMIVLLRRRTAQPD